MMINWWLCPIGDSQRSLPQTRQDDKLLINLPSTLDCATCVGTALFLIAFFLSVNLRIGLD